MKEIDLKDYKPTLETVDLVTNILHTINNKMAAIRNQQYQMAAEFRDEEKIYTDEFEKITGCRLTNCEMVDTKKYIRELKTIALLGD